MRDLQTVAVAVVAASGRASDGRNKKIVARCDLVFFVLCSLGGVLIDTDRGADDDEKREVTIGDGSTTFASRRAARRRHQPTD